MSKQLLLYNNINNIDTYNNNNSNANTSFILQYETSKSLLLDVLYKKGYFDFEYKESIIRPQEKWLNRIKNCGIERFPVRLGYSPCGHDVDFDVGCGSRLCSSCLERTRAKLIKKIGFVIGQMKYIRFLTISPRNYTVKEYRSGFAYKDLQRLWNNIRIQLKKVHSYSFGIYVSVPEKKFNQKGSEIRHRKTGEILGYHKEDNWNVHLHVTFDGMFIPQKIISDIMQRVSKGESRYCYIEGMRSRNSLYSISKCVKYLAKYLGKFDIPEDNFDALVDYHMVTKNSKFVTFSRGLDKIKFVEYKRKCPICFKGSLAEIDINFKPGFIKSIFIDPYYKIGLPKSKPPPYEKKEELIPAVEEELVLDTPLSKIQHLLNKEGNGFVIESILTKQELSYLLQIGDIYESRVGTYKIL